MSWGFNGKKRRRQQRHQATVAQANELARLTAQIEASRLISEFEQRKILEAEMEERELNLSYQQAAIDAEKRMMASLDPEMRGIVGDIVSEMKHAIEKIQEKEDEGDHQQSNTTMITIKSESELEETIESWGKENPKEKYLLVKNLEAQDWYVCEKNDQGDIVGEGFLDEMENPQEFLKVIRISTSKSSPKIETAAIKSSQLEELTPKEDPLWLYQSLCAGQQSGMSTGEQRQLIERIELASGNRVPRIY